MINLKAGRTFKERLPFKLSAHYSINLPPKSSGHHWIKDPRMRLKGARRTGNRMHTASNDARRAHGAVKGSAAPSPPPSLLSMQIDYRDVR